MLEVKMKFKKFLTIFIVFTILSSLLIAFFPVIEESYSTRNDFSDPINNGACLKYYFCTFNAFFKHGSINSVALAYIYLKGNGNSYSVKVNAYSSWANESARNSSFIENFLLYPNHLSPGNLVVVNGVTGVVHECIGSYINVGNNRVIYTSYEVSQSNSQYCFLPTTGSSVLKYTSCSLNQSLVINLLDDIFHPMNKTLIYSTNINGNRGSVDIHLTLLGSNVKFTSIDYYGYFINSLPILIIFLVFDTSFLSMLIHRVKLKRKRLNNDVNWKKRNGSSGAAQPNGKGKKWKF